jgi:hypothetical protein
MSFWRRRHRRCLTTNRRYEVVRCGSVRGFTVRDLDLEDLRELMADPDRAFRRPDARLLKKSKSSVVADIPVRLHGRACRVIYKRFSVTSWLDPWLSLLRDPAAVRSWIFGHALRVRLVPTARPLAVFFRRRFGLKYEAYLITEKIEDALDLHCFLEHLKNLSRDERRTELRQGIDQLAKLAQDMHQRNISYRDFKAVNVLIAQQTIWLIDLAGMAFWPKISRRRKIKDLARLNASFIHSQDLTRSDRLRFLRVYMQWGVLGRLGWKEWWREIDQLTQEKISRNARSGRPLA